MDGYLTCNPDLANAEFKQELRKQKALAKKQELEDRLKQMLKEDVI